MTGVADGAILQHYEDGIVSVKVQQGRVQRLICTCSQYSIRGNCKHVIEAVSHRRDAATLFGPGVWAHVTIFQKPPLSVVVRQGEYLDSSNNLVPLTVGTNVHPYDEARIGLFLKGDGRVDMRSTFLDWVLGQVQVDSASDEVRHICESPSHSGPVDPLALWSIDTTGPALAAIVTDYWLVRSVQRCVKCHTAETIDI